VICDATLYIGERIISTTPSGAEDTGKHQPVNGLSTPDPATRGRADVVRRGRPRASPSRRGGRRRLALARGVSSATLSPHGQRTDGDVTASDTFSLRSQAGQRTIGMADTLGGRESFADYSMTAADSPPARRGHSVAGARGASPDLLFPGGTMTALSALDVPATDPTPIFELFRGSYATELLTAAVAHFRRLPPLPERPNHRGGPALAVAPRREAGDGVADDTEVVRPAR